MRELALRSLCMGLGQFSRVDIWFAQVLRKSDYSTLERLASCSERAALMRVMIAADPAPNHSGALRTLQAPGRQCTSRPGWMHWTRARTSMLPRLSAHRPAPTRHAGAWTQPGHRGWGGQAGAGKDEWARSASPDFDVHVARQDMKANGLVSPTGGTD
jgi:hypothetical protein